MSLPTLESVQKLQTALHAKAKRRENPSSASTRCTTRCTGTMSCGRLGGAAWSTAGHRASTDKPSRTSKRVTRRSGWKNWRRNSGRRRTSRRFLLLAPEEIVARLNRRLRGWANDFRLGPVSRAYRAVDRYVTSRLRRWLCKKHKVPGAGTARYPDDYLYQQLGLIRLPTRTRNLPWAKA